MANNDKFQGQAGSAPSWLSGGIHTLSTAAGDVEKHVGHWLTDNGTLNGQETPAKPHPSHPSIVAKTPVAHEDMHRPTIGHHAAGAETSAPAGDSHMTSGDWSALSKAVAEGGGAYLHTLYQQSKGIATRGPQ